MAYIKKLKYNELVGGTDNTDVYPVTSTEAVYGPDNINQQAVNEDRLRRIELLESNVQSLDGLKEMVEAFISDDYDYQGGLSDNNFTDELKAKLEGLENYNDAELRQLLADIDTAKANAADVYTKSEIDDKLGDIQGALTFDNTPIAGSDNPVKSSGIYTALQGKQDTISDIANIRSGAAAGATAVQPATLQEGLATKQDVIEDLSTIRSGAATGATAVQPAAMNTALAAKQDTLTFDNTPTANSNNPVKSGGVYQAIQDIDVSSQISGKEDNSNKVTSFISPTDTQYPSAKLVNDQLATKQDVISDLSAIISGAAAGATAVQSVTIGTTTTGAAGTDASVINTGTTTELVLSFTIPEGAKGDKGDTGETGPQGPQGERGLPGESGVTGDVSGFTVIQTIDPSATYGATDIAGAATVQATNEELTELAGGVYNAVQPQNISYKHSHSSLPADNIQEALDEITDTVVDIIIKQGENDCQIKSISDATLYSNGYKITINTDGSGTIDSGSNSNYVVAFFEVSKESIFRFNATSTAGINVRMGITTENPVEYAEEHGSILGMSLQDAVRYDNEGTSWDIKKIVKHGGWMAFYYHIGTNNNWNNILFKEYTIKSNSGLTFDYSAKFFHPLNLVLNNTGLFISTSTGKWSSDLTRWGNATYIRDYRGYKIKIKAPSNNTARYAFLQDGLNAVANGIPNYCDGESSIPLQLLQGNEVVRTIPEDCSFLYTYVKNANGYCYPDVEILMEDEVVADTNYSEQDYVDIDTNSYPLISNIINANNIWQESSTVSHNLIPLDGVRKVKVNGISGTIIAFLQDDEDSGIPSFAISQPTRIQTSGGIYDVPKDAHYLYVRRFSSSTDYGPTSLGFAYTYTDEDAAIRRHLYNARFAEERNGVTSSVLTIFQCSDLHQSLYSAQEFVADYNKFKDLIDVPIHTGDAMQPGFSDGNFAFWDNAGMGFVLNTPGNHDTWNGSSSDGDSRWYKISRESVYDRFIGPYVEDWDVVQPDGVDDSTSDYYKVCYYYKDFAAKKIRMIVYDSMCTNTDQTQRVQDIANQNQWLVDTMNAAKVLGYSVVILSHYPCNNIKSESDNTSFATIDWKDTILASPLKLDDTPAQLVSEFIEGGGDFICWISGHRHVDDFGWLKDYPNIPCVVIEKSGSNSNSSCNDNYRTHESARLNGRPCQHSFNIITIDRYGEMNDEKHERILKIVRVGNTEDRRLRQKHGLCVDLVAKKIVSSF